MIGNNLRCEAVLSGVCVLRLSWRWLQQDAHAHAQARTY